MTKVQSRNATDLAPKHEPDKLLQGKAAFELYLKELDKYLGSLATQTELLAQALETHPPG